MISLAAEQASGTVTPHSFRLGGDGEDGGHVGVAVQAGGEQVIEPGLGLESVDLATGEWTWRSGHGRDVVGRDETPVGDDADAADPKRDWRSSSTPAVGHGPIGADCISWSVVFGP